MHWTRRVSLICLVAIGWTNISSAQSIIDSASEVVFLDDFSGSMALSNDGGSYLLIHKVVGEGVGHRDGFTRVGLRAKLFEEFDSHFFGEAHALFTDDSRLGLNVGGGYRWFTGGGVAGVNGWFDNYESHAGNHYQQITGGFEYLSPEFDIRTNAYIPINNRENNLGVIDAGAANTAQFSNYFITTQGTALFERANYGWDGEVGTQVPVIEWLRAYAGSYFLTHSGNDTWGARGRLEASVWEGGNVNFMVSNDNKFGTNFNLGVEVRFSGGMPTRFKSDYGPISRRYDQVRRQWNVQVSRDVDAYAVAVQKQNGDDLRFFHVDPTAGAGGDGTWENPYQQLPGAARNSDIILVQTGNVGGRVDLINNQQILGEGKLHQVQTRQFGMIDLPSAFSSTATLPTLTGGNAIDPAIRLANNNRVVGFDFDTINGIAGENIQDFHLECLEGDVLNGINIENGYGNGVVRTVDFTVDPGGTGVFLSNENAARGLTLDIDDVTTTGGDFGLALDADGGNILYTLDGYTGTMAAEAALSLSANNAYISGAGTNINTSNNLGHGVAIDIENGTGKTTLTGIHSSNNGIDGINAVADASSNYSLDVIGSVALPSSLSMNTDDNIQTDAVNSSTMNVFIDPITLADAGDNAYEFLADNKSTINTTLVDVTMMGSGNDAVNGVVRDSVGRMTIADSNGSNSGDDGVDVLVTNNSTFTGAVNNSVFSGNVDNGVQIHATQGSTAQLDLNALTSNMNGNAGLVAESSGGGLGQSTLTVNGSGGTNLSNNTINNVVGRASGNSTTNLNMTNVLADNAASGGGVLLDATTGGRVNSNWVGGSISNTDSDGVRAIGTGTNSRIDMIFNSVAINDNAADGIDASLSAANNGQLNVGLLNSSLIGNTLNGLDYEIDGNNALGSIAFSNTAATGNGRDGFQFDVTGGADIIGVATGIGNDFSNNGNNGIDGTVDGVGSTAVVNIDGANADATGHAGILLDTNNSGMLTFNYSNGSASGNARDGIFVNSDNGSIANINLDTVNLFSNGQSGVSSGDGLTAIADNGSTINVGLNNTLAFGNREKGFNFMADNASTISVSPTGAPLSASFNGEEGLNFDIRGGSMFALNALDGQFSNNGLFGSFSGVRGNVTGAGSQASVSFDGSQVTGNTRNGFEFTASNGATFIGELISSTQTTPLTVTGNAGDGISLNAFGGGTTAALIMEGTPLLTNNVSGNGGVGLRATSNDGNQLAVQADGNFSNNGSDGIQITSNNTTQTAIEISSDGTRSVSDNGGAGVNIMLSNTQLMSTNVTTLTQTEAVESLDISGLRVDSNNGHGVSVQGNGIDLSNGSITNVNADNNQGDGIRLALTDSTLNTFNIANNGTQNNTGNGINVDLTRTVSDGLSINDNTGAASLLNVGFLVDGITEGQLFSITNLSDPNFDITSLTWDLSPLGFFGPVFNTAGANSTAFAPQFGTDTVTGLTQVNGVVGPLFAAAAVPDNSQFLNMTFNDFNPTESIIWDIDLNETQFSTADISGDQLIGSSVIVNFNGGAQLVGQLGAVAGNPDAASFNATTTTQVTSGSLANGGSGIRLNANDSTLTNTTINGNIASSNTGSGIDIQIENGSMVNSLTVNDNTTSMNGGRGVNLNATDSTINDVVIDGTIADQNQSDGILVAATNSTGNNLDVSGSTVTDSLGRGIAVVGDNSPIDNVTLDDNDVLNSGGDGIQVSMTNSAVSGTLTVSNTSSENNAGHGLNLGLNGSAVGTLNVSGNNAGTALPGGMIDVNFRNLIWSTFVENDNSAGLDIATFRIDLPAGRIFRSDDTPFTSGGFGVDGGSDVTTGLTTVNGVDVIAGTDPLQDLAMTALPEGGVVTGATFVEFDFNDFNPGESFDYSLAHSLLGQNINGDISGAVGTVTLNDGRTASAVAANSFGLRIQETFVQTFGGISSNTGNGILLSATNGSNIGALTMDDNSIQDNGVHGVEFNIVDSTLPTVGAPGIISNTTISNHTNGDAFRMLTPDTNGTPIGLDFVNNTMSENSGTAINISLDDNAGGLTSTMSGNTIDNNGGFGVRVDAIESTDLNLTIGAAGTANTITNNNDAGIAVTMANNTTGTLSVSNTTVDGTVDGADADFNGQGLAVRLTDNANLSALTIGDPTTPNTSFTNNAGNGIEISQNLTTTLTNPTIQNTTSSNNGGDGLNYVRSGDGTMDNFSITDSVFSGNTGDGLDIISGITDKTDEFTIDGNTVDANGGRGLAMQVQINSDIVADITDNTITNSGGTGVEFTEVTSAVPASDTRSITANLNGNTISNNGGQGIDVQALHDLDIDNNTIDSNSLQGINLASAAINPADPTTITNNMISNNGSGGGGTHGIDIANVDNTVTITGNTITGSGAGNSGNGINNVLGVNSTVNDNTISNNADNGIAINNGTHTFNNNMVESNGNDGIQLISNSDVNGLVFNADGNMVRTNGGRGINLLVSGTTVADVTFDNGTVEGNNLQGVYVVNTASTTQGVDAAATAALASNGDILANPELVFNFNNNNVTTNGIGSGFTGNGLVLRVGTSGASTAVSPWEDNGGLVSDGLGFTTGNLTGRGGVLANVTGNTITGQPGSDVLIESFVSTVNPADSVGTWTAGAYNITTFEQDPLARLDLNFVGNTGEDLDVTRAGASFNNAEDVFKSRTTGQALAGPFAAGTRARNAQRLAGRGGAFAPPVSTVGLSGDSDNFLYSGVGTSTFRITNASDLGGAGFTGGDNFLTTEPLGVGTGEEPFGWTTY